MSEQREKEDLLLIHTTNGNIEKIKALINEGVDVNATSPDSWTALHYAMKYLPHLKDKDYLGITKLLVDHRANLNASLDNRLSVLFEAGSRWGCGGKRTHKANRAR